MKKPWYRWAVILTLLLSTLFLGVSAFRFYLRVKNTTKILHEEWNPWGNPPEYQAKNPSTAAAITFVIYIYKTHPTEDELGSYICDFEKEAKLIPRPERAKRVAKLVLDAYDFKK